jgi:hypothetical protein
VIHSSMARQVDEQLAPSDGDLPPHHVDARRPVDAPAAASNARFAGPVRNHNPRSTLRDCSAPVVAAGIVRRCPKIIIASRRKPPAVQQSMIPGGGARIRQPVVCRDTRHTVRSGALPVASKPARNFSRRCTQMPRAGVKTADYSLDLDAGLAGINQQVRTQPGCRKVIAQSSTVARPPSQPCAIHGPRRFHKPSPRSRHPADS